MKAIQVPMKCFNDIIKELNHTSIDILKMDIEGSEYDVLPDILSSRIEIKQIVVEFHHRMIAGGGKLTKKAINLLKESGFKLFAYSKSIEEFSFINMKYYQ
jgi:translation initiation factor 2 beta subunit (eIF-2beta)/eIF-5